MGLFALQIKGTESNLTVREEERVMLDGTLGRLRDKTLHIYLNEYVCLFMYVSRFDS